jgi:Fungal chitosanase of glycosyl hydrolase group 75
MATPCIFSEANMQFAGTPAEQAASLLRKVKVVGNVDDAVAALPQVLTDTVGKPVSFTRSQLQAYLDLKGIVARDVGGSLDKGVSVTSNGTKARYFVIHDTSDELEQNSFPVNINDASWPGNNLAKRTTSSAHIFINRLGQSVTGHDYSQPWRATKRERKPIMKGLFLHHENIQPRIKGSFRFAAVGPQPGYTAAQLERLAVCYLAASLRAGNWLIPAFHCVLDLGISDGHDDPQNFDLFQWAAAVEKVSSEVRSAAAPPAVASASLAPAAPAPGADAPELETVRTDLSDGKRRIKVQRIKGTTALFFKAKIACDADGAARAYHPANDPEALDVVDDATVDSMKFIQGKKKNGKTGLGPRPGFFVSDTALCRGVAWDANSFVDAEFTPYIVLPENFADGVGLGTLCTVVNLNNFRTTSAIFADTNPKVGEASVRTVINLHVNDPSMPITDLAKHGGNEKDRYVYIVYPGEKLAARAAVPHWPAEDIAAKGDALFAAWGGIDLVKRLFGTS